MTSSFPLPLPVGSDALAAEAPPLRLPAGADTVSAELLLAAAQATWAIAPIAADTGLTPGLRRLMDALGLMGVSTIQPLVIAEEGVPSAAAVARVQAQCRAVGPRLAGVLTPAVAAAMENRGQTAPVATTSAKSAGASVSALPLRLLLAEPMAGNGHQAQGRIVSGRSYPGQRVRLQTSGREATVAHVLISEQIVAEAGPGAQVTLQLAPGSESVRSAGDVLIAAADEPAQVADQFETTLFWLDQQALYRGRTYQLHLGTQQTVATVTDIKYQLDPESSEHLAARQVENQSVAVCNLNLEQPVVFDPYAGNRATGLFTLHDSVDQRLTGVGLIHFALRRAHNIHLQNLEIDKAARSAAYGQKPCVLWFTGLSGAGKSAIANRVEKKLFAAGYRTYLLDGDNVRHGLNKDLGFTQADRVENIRRIAEVAKLMVDAGLIVLTAFISPFREERRMARGLLAPDEFIEIHIDTPLAVAEARDPKGLYKKARSGQLKNFTGIDSPYEMPEAPEIRIDGANYSIDQAADLIIAHMTGSAGGLAPRP